MKIMKTQTLLAMIGFGLIFLFPQLNASAQLIIAHPHYLHALGKGDEEVLHWITKHSTTKPTAWEIAQWSAYQEQRGLGSLEARKRSIGYLEKLSKTREDIFTSFDMLDLDDHVTFGGKA